MALTAPTVSGGTKPDCASVAARKLVPTDCGAASGPPPLLERGVGGSGGVVVGGQDATAGEFGSSRRLRRTGFSYPSSVSSPRRSPWLGSHGFSKRSRAMISATVSVIPRSPTHGSKGPSCARACVATASNAASDSDAERAKERATERVRVVPLCIGERAEGGGMGGPRLDSSALFDSRETGVASRTGKRFPTARDFALGTPSIVPAPPSDNDCRR